MGAYRLFAPRELWPDETDAVAPPAAPRPNAALSPLTQLGPAAESLRIDLNALRRDEKPIPVVRPVARDFNMPGGGYEIHFPYNIDPKYLRLVPRE